MKLENVLDGCVTEDGFSLYHIDGSKQKTSKSKLLEGFNCDTIDDMHIDHVSIVDIGLATPADDREAHKCEDAEYTWNNYLHKISIIVCSRHGKELQCPKYIPRASDTFPQHQISLQSCQMLGTKNQVTEIGESAHDRKC